MTDFITILNATKPIIKGHPDIHVETRGKWVWITGNTSPVRDELIKAGYKYSKGKGCFYWSPGGYRKRSKNELPLDKIRLLYDGVKIC